ILLTKVARNAADPCAAPDQLVHRKDFVDRRGGKQINGHRPLRSVETPGPLTMTGRRHVYHAMSAEVFGTFGGPEPQKIVWRGAENSIEHPQLLRNEAGVWQFTKPERHVKSLRYQVYSLA